MERDFARNKRCVACFYGILCARIFDTLFVYSSFYFQLNYLLFSRWDKYKRETIVVQCTCVCVFLCVRACVFAYPFLHAFSCEFAHSLTFVSCLQNSVPRPGGGSTTIPFRTSCQWSWDESCLWWWWWLPVGAACSVSNIFSWSSRSAAAKKDDNCFEIASELKLGYWHLRFYYLQTHFSLHRQ